MSPRVDTAVRIAVTLACAAVLSLISTPFEWWWFHPVVYLPMFWVIRPGKTRANLLYGWLYGAFGVALIFRWIVGTIVTFSHTFNLVTAFGVLCLFGAVFGSPWALVWAAWPELRARLGSWWVLAFPALLVVVDWISSFILLFPFQHGVTLYRVPTLWQLVSITGIWGPTFLVVVWNTSLAEGWLRWRAQRRAAWLPPAAVGAATAAIAVWGAARFTRIEKMLESAPALRVAQLQSAHGMQWRMSHDSSEAWDEWMALTQRLPPGSVDLVVWPEAACPYDLNADKRHAEALAQLARDGGFALVVGAGAREKQQDPQTGKVRWRLFNTVYFFGPTGQPPGRYDKMVPLPFGEYLPFSESMPWLLGWIEGVGDFKAGTTPTVWDSGKGRLASPICYEAILGRVCRLFDDPDLLVNVTNDAWFGDTASPHQHAMLAAERATELGIPMYRSAYTGKSMAVEPHGFIHAETTPFEETARIVTVRLGRVDTIYGRFGDWFVGVCALGLAGGYAADRVRRRAASSASTPSASGDGAAPP
jgi:apolipoprotein N-acyltransferase